MTPKEEAQRLIKVFGGFTKSHSSLPEFTDAETHYNYTRACVITCVCEILNAMRADCLLQSGDYPINIALDNEREYWEEVKEQLESLVYGNTNKQ